MSTQQQQPKAAQEQQFVAHQCYLEGDTPTQAADRSARIIQRAVAIMAEGHHGWSWALDKARAEIEQGK